MKVEHICRVDLSARSPVRSLSWTSDGPPPWLWGSYRRDCTGPPARSYISSLSTSRTFCRVSCEAYRQPPDIDWKLSFSPEEVVWVDDNRGSKHQPHHQHCTLVRSTNVNHHLHPYHQCCIPPPLPLSLTHLTHRLLVFAIRVQRFLGITEYVHTVHFKGLYPTFMDFNVHFYIFELLKVNLLVCLYKVTFWHFNFTRRLIPVIR